MLFIYFIQFYINSILRSSTVKHIYCALSLPTYFKTNSKLLLLGMVICSTLSYTLTSKAIFILSYYPYFYLIFNIIIIAGILNLFLLKFNCIIKIYSIIFKGLPFFLKVYKVTHLKLLFDQTKLPRRTHITLLDLHIIMFIYFFFNLFSLLISVILIVKITHSLEEFNAIVGECGNGYTNLMSIISSLIYINHIFDNKYILDSNNKINSIFIRFIVIFYFLFLILGFIHFSKTLQLETTEYNESLPEISQKSTLDLKNFEDLIKLSGNRYIRKRISIVDVLDKIDYSKDKSKYDFYRNVWYSEITPELANKYKKLNIERSKALFGGKFSPADPISGLVPHFTHKELRINLDLYAFWDNYKFLIHLHNKCLLNRYELKYSVIRLMYHASKQHVDNQYYFRQIFSLLENRSLNTIYYMPVDYFNYPIYMNGFYSMCLYAKGMNHPIIHNLPDKLHVYEVLEFIDKEKIKTQKYLDTWGSPKFNYKGLEHYLLYLECLDETKNNFGNTRYIQYFNDSYVGDQINLFSDKDISSYALDSNKLLNRLHFDSNYNFFVFKHRNYFTELIEVKPIPTNNIFQVLFYSWDSRQKLLSDYSDVINYNSQFIEEGLSKLNFVEGTKLYLSSCLNLYSYLVNLPNNIYENSLKYKFSINIVKKVVEEYIMLNKLDKAIKIHESYDLKRDENGIIYKESWANLLGGHNNQNIYPDSIDYTLYPPINADDESNLVEVFKNQKAIKN